jgi:hypothetical protein
MIANGVFITDSTSRSLATLFFTVCRITITETESVAEIRVAKISESITCPVIVSAYTPYIRSKGIGSKSALYHIKIVDNFNALNDKVSKVFNLSLELESKRIITRAIILILVKNTGENTTKGLLLYFI